MSNNIKGFIIATIIFICGLCWLANIPGQSNDELFRGAEFFNNIEMKKNDASDMPVSHSVIDEIITSIDEMDTHYGKDEQQIDNKYEEEIDIIDNELNQNYPEE